MEIAEGVFWAFVYVLHYFVFIIALSGVVYTINNWLFEEETEDCIEEEEEEKDDGHYGEFSYKRFT